MKLNRKGSILVLTALVSTSLFVMAGTYLSRIVFENRMTNRSYRHTAAVNLAEAGIERAIYEYGYGDITTWAVDANGDPTQTITLSDAGGSTIGSVTVTVTNSATGTPTVTATGTAPNVTDINRFSKLINTNLQVSGSPFAQGIFGDKSVTLSGNGATDSYDSNNGTYASQPPGSNGSVGTNATSSGAVSLSGNAIVNGNAQIGPGGNINTAITTSGNSVLNGQKTVASTLFPMPSVTVPAGVSSSGQLQISGNNTQTLTSGTYWFSSIQITGNATLIISGQVTIYVSGTCKVAGNGVSNPGNPSDCLLYGTDSCTSMQFTGNGDFAGAICAPKAELKVSGNGDLFGAFVGDTVKIPGNGNVHYDEALANVNPGGFPGTVTITQWYD